MITKFNNQINEIFIVHNNSVEFFSLTHRFLLKNLKERKRKKERKEEEQQQKIAALKINT